MYGSYRFKEADKQTDVFFELFPEKLQSKAIARLKFQTKEQTLELKVDADDLHNMGHLLRKAAHQLCKENNEPYNPPTTELDQYES